MRVQKGRMATALCLVALCFIAAAPLASASFHDLMMKFMGHDPALRGGLGGGGTCAACSVVIGLVDQLAVIHDEPVADILSKVCGWLPSEAQEPCKKIVTKYGPYVIKYLGNKMSPDEVCLKVNLCTLPQCRLWPKEHQTMETVELDEDFLPGGRSSSPLQSIMSPWDFIVKEVERVFDSHEPLVDFDNDLHGPEKTLRGSDWRGKDCNDWDANIYPGRIEDASQPEADKNCNGIKGTDPETGKSYEELFCADSQQMGTVILGDSAAAHFHIPPEYLDPTKMGPGVYKELISTLANEFDWPQQSSTTAFVNQADPDCPGQIASLYEFMRSRNRCNHRDFQNIAVNGARSGAMNSTIVRSLSRDQNKDHPVLAFYALIGNDVCNGHPDYEQHMTKPEEFKANVISALEYLDTKLPKGSKVVFVGLADGRVLYDNMHDREHPVGRGVKYSDLYNYLNCLQLSPCLVWMNTNSTIRDAGTARAVELNEQYPAIIQERNFTNFEMAYYDFPFGEVEEIWKQGGGEVWQLIEPVDGFHPNQNAMALTAKVLYQKLEKDHPDWLGPINPNNDAIDKVFGDQGGY